VPPEYTEVNHYTNLVYKYAAVNAGKVTHTLNSQMKCIKYVSKGNRVMGHVVNLASLPPG